MVQLVQLNCPQCNATLEVEASRKFCFCTYCGAKAILDDGSVTTRIIDDARIREAEALERIKLKEAETNLEIQKIKLEKRQKNKEDLHTTILTIAIFIILWAAMLVMLYLQK